MEGDLNLDLSHLNVATPCLKFIVTLVTLLPSLLNVQLALLSSRRRVAYIQNYYLAVADCSSGFHSGPVLSLRSCDSNELQRGISLGVNTLETAFHPRLLSKIKLFEQLVISGIIAQVGEHRVLIYPDYLFVM